MEVGKLLHQVVFEMAGGRMFGEEAFDMGFIGVLFGGGDDEGLGQ